MIQKIFCILICLSFIACRQASPAYTGPLNLFLPIQLSIDSILKIEKDEVEKIINFYKRQVEAEQPFIKAGLVNIKIIIPTIHIDLRYSSQNNFMGIDVYKDIANAYLQLDVANKLALAQNFLREKHQYYCLLVYDAARPLTVQQLMWDTIQVPQGEKTKYLSNPQYGSLHNYGAAVDVGIIDSLGKELDMGTPYDFFGEEAYPVRETAMVSQGKLSIEQVKNRQLLREVMYRAGFFNIQTEWWHFNACTLASAIRMYEKIE